MGNALTPGTTGISPTAPGPSPERVRRQMERLFASPEFQATDAQRAFLRYVVERTLAGEASEIKGYTVATEVFGRPEHFDQSTDPIVSIQANKLRRALERYYLTAGGQDPLRIDIPKGAYVPVFAEQDREDRNRRAEDAEGASWPVVFVRPFKNLSGDAELDFWGIGLATEMATELSRYPDIRVLAFRSGDPKAGPPPAQARFEMDGCVRCDGESVKVAVWLTDTRSGQQVWRDSRRARVEAANLISFQEEIARQVAVVIAGEWGVIAKTLVPGLKKQPPARLTTYEAILRYYEYDLHQTPQSFLRALAALENAVAVEPECGQAWSMLGRIYANIYSLDIPGYDKPLVKAFECAKTGIRLDPENQRCRVLMSYVHLLGDELAQGVAEAERALALNRNSLFFLDGIGYLLTLLGEWERGPALIRRVSRLNPFPSYVVHYALWADWLRQERYPEACRETLNLNRPALFWDPLCRAASLGLLDKIEPGEEAAKRLLALKPDFAAQGARLIRIYVKFDDIFGRIVEGLRRTGIELA